MRVFCGGVITVTVVCWRILVQFHVINLGYVIFLLISHFGLYSGQLPHDVAFTPLLTVGG